MRRIRSRLRECTRGVVLLALAPALSAAERFTLFPCGALVAERAFSLAAAPCVREDPEGGPDRALRLPEAEAPLPASPPQTSESRSQIPPALRPAPRNGWWISDSRLLDGRTLLLTTAFLVSAGVHGYDSWWKDSRRFSFHADGEGGLAFGRSTYTGGADKASHFIGSYAASQELAKIYGLLGKPAAKSRLLGAGTAWLAGLIIEAGDGFSVFGYSWGDVLANTLGAAAGAELTRLEWDDLVGFRLGSVPYSKPPRAERGPGLGSDYSREVYSADLKLAGLFSRLRRRPGIARFLLLSLTYGTKGYRFHPPEVRERNVGLDLGLNLPEILRALGLRDESWWARPILEYLTYRRIAFTAIGLRYDLNHRRWNGPDTGDGYDPRP